MADGINLRLRRRDMNVFRTIDQDGRRPVVHVAGKHPVALCPGCSRPSVTTNGTGWRDVIDVVRTVVVTLSICVRRFVCEFEDCEKRSFDERFEGIGRGGATDRALGFFVDLQRGRATRRVAIDLGVPHHDLRLGGRQEEKGCLLSPSRPARSPPRHRRVQCSEELCLRDGLLRSAGRSRHRPRPGSGRLGGDVLRRPLLTARTGQGPRRYDPLPRSLPHGCPGAVSERPHRRRCLPPPPSCRLRVDRGASGGLERLAAAVPKMGRVFKSVRFALMRPRDELEEDTSRHGKRQRMLIFDATNLDRRLDLAYELKEAFRAAMAIGKRGDEENFAVAIDLFVTWCRESRIEAFVTLANTIEAWRKEILNYAAFWRSLERLCREPQSFAQEPKAPGARISHLGRFPRPDALDLR